jgi:phosphate transport system permease protein
LGSSQTQVDINERPSLKLDFFKQESLVRDSQSIDNKYKKEKLIELLLLSSSILSGALILFIIYFVVSSAMPAITHNGIGFIVNGGWDQQLQELWGNPTEDVKFGALPIILGTLLTTGGAVVITLFLGMGCVIILSELAPDWMKGPVESVVRLLASIPSVVFGLIGLVVVAPAINSLFITNELVMEYIKIAPLDGTSLLAGIIVLTFMIMPFFITVATDSLNALPKQYRDGSLALGLTHWKTITRLLLPAALPGIIAGLILAIARGVGEAIAMSMVTGSVGLIPNPQHGLVFFLEPLKTMAASIVDNGEAMPVDMMKSTLFALGTILLMLSIVLSLTARVITKWFNKRVMAQ